MNRARARHADPTSRARAELATRWAEGTPLADLAATLGALDDPDAEDVAAAVRPVLANAAWLDTVVARLARAVRADPLLEPPLAPVSGAVHSGLLLYRGRHAAIFAGVGSRDALAAKRMRPRAGSIVVPGQLGMMRVLVSGGACLSLWRGGWRDGAIAQACMSAGVLRPCDGDLVEIDGRDTGFVVEHARGDLVLLQATIFAGSAPTTFAYDAATLRLTGLGASLEEASRAQMLVTLLAGLDIADADAFATLSHRPEAHSRWHAMRAWASLDAASARSRLREMARSDPDDELRRLASSTLDLIDARCPA